MHQMLSKNVALSVETRLTAGDQGLLLDLPIPFRMVGDRLQIEVQALNGLRLWLANFSYVTVCAPLLPLGSPDEALYDWADPAALLADPAIKLVALPWGYRGFDSIKLASQIRATLQPLIDAHRYLCFSNVGSFGAWSNVGVELAIKRRHPYSVWFDNVAHEMPRNPSKSMLQAAKSWMNHKYSKSCTMYSIRHAALGLFHGRTVFEAYASHCPHSELVHDIHLGPQDALSDGALAEKLLRQQPSEVLRIGYAGRVHPIKGPFEWIEALAELARRVGQERFEATWYGGGPALEEARNRVKAAGLEQSVRFVGHERSRENLLASLRELDVFLFCHRTPESPRCLLEALISCTPLVGYESAFVRDLVEHRGGGEFVNVGDTTGLASKLERLVGDRSLLRELVQSASASRGIYNDEAVFHHRSELIKAHLHWQRPTSPVGSWCHARGISAVIVVSPHLDDGVLSAHSVLADRTLEQRLLVTVFSDAPAQGQSDWARHTGFATTREEFETRRQEDVAAARIIGVEVLHLNEHAQAFSDAQARHTAERILASSASSLGATLILLPAGAGGVLSAFQQFTRRFLRKPFGSPPHGEHLTVRDALLQPLRTSGVRFGFYAELPYACSDHMDQLTHRVEAISGQAMMTVTGKPELDAKYVAVCAYRSQLEPILGSKQSYQKRVLAHPEVFFLPV